MQEIHDGDLVANGVLMGRLHDLKQWYIPSIEQEEVIRLRKVAEYNIRLQPVSEDNQLPNSYPNYPFVETKTWKQKQFDVFEEALKLSLDEINIIMHKIRKREQIDYLEDMAHNLVGNNNNNNDPESDAESYDSLH